MTTIIKHQSPLTVPPTECHRLRDALNLNPALGAVCQDVTIRGDTEDITMVFDVEPVDAEVDATLAAYSAPVGLVESAYADSLWVQVLPAPGSGVYFDITTFELEAGRVAMASFSVGVCTGTAADAKVGSWTLSFAARRNAGGSVEVPRLPRLSQAEGGIQFRVHVDGPSTVRVQSKRPGSSQVKVCVIKSEIVRDQL